MTTRRVVAIQNGKQILNMSASFHVQDEGWDHQHAMPQAKAPENYPDRSELRQRYVDQVPQKLRGELLRERPIQVREVNHLNPFNPGKSDDHNQIWFRMTAAAGTDPVTQHLLLAYASDMYLMTSGMRPHGLSWFSGEVNLASLDHALWFHAPVHFENWHLYAMESPWSGQGTQFQPWLDLRRRWYSGRVGRSGRLDAKNAQEILSILYKLLI